MSDAPVLDAVGIVHHFRTSKGQTVHAVNDVALQIGQGETLALVGESGCGKSTLGRIVMGLDRPDAGHVMLMATILRRCAVATFMPSENWRR